jgi:ergothioneine biosynthesis protein EgtB
MSWGLQGSLREDEKSQHFLHEKDSDASGMCVRYRLIRQQTEVICTSLHIDDYNLQGMPETSPPKWHLAHTTWFFETFVLAEFMENYKFYNSHFSSLFNSYYTGTGSAAFSRLQRGILTRPTICEVSNYRRAIDEQILALLQSNHQNCGEIFQRIELGLQHEQQHQELLLTDIKFGFSLNPMLPVFCERVAPNFPHHPALPSPEKLHWIEFEQHLCEIGADKNSRNFYFDNEAPRHSLLVHGFALSERVVTNGEYLDFIGDKGYERPELWLADGWHLVEKNRWQAPLYWRRHGNNWSIFTLHGELPLQLNEPLCHINYYEADAYARWANARMPTEAEWESVACQQRVEGHFIDDGVLHPRAAVGEKGAIKQLFGDVWEWTASAYMAYPGYAAQRGALGEYNGKFMCNQMVLRGGSCVSARTHLRATYRNFFYPADRWQFSGIRLARSLA